MLLSERQLAASLKMSKTPVHAALERLESDGLVTVAVQQGIVVRSITPRRSPTTSRSARLSKPSSFLGSRHG